MTDRWTSSTGGRPMTVRLTTDARPAPARPVTKGVTTPRIEPGDTLVLAETGERSRFELRRGDEVLGRLRQLKTSMTLTLGDRRLTIRPEGDDLLLVAERATVARFDDRRFRGDRIVLADGTLFPFEGDDERLTTAEGRTIARYVAKNPDSASRLVRVSVEHQPLDPEAGTTLLAFAAAIVVWRRLPAVPATRYGQHGGKAGDSVGAKFGGWGTGHSDGAF